MSVLDRATLDESPLADLHTIASELSIDGYRRLRRADLIGAILERQGGGLASAGATDELQDDERDRIPRRRRGRRGGRGRVAGQDEEQATQPEDEAQAKDSEAEAEPQPRRDSGPTDSAREGDAGERSREQGRGDDQRTDGEQRAGDEERPGGSTRAGGAARRPRNGRSAEPEDDQLVEGIVELLANGSGFLRVSPPETSDDDAYISAAQVKRCELVAGDRIAGPRRAPRRSERFPSLVRIDTINGRAAAEVAEGARFEDLPAAFPAEPFDLGVRDAMLGAIAAVAPFGKGSRVTIVGPARTGKTEILRALAAALGSSEGLELSIVLAGVRPEEINEWAKGRVEPAGAVSFASSADAQAVVVERVVEQGRRIAARGADAVVLVDTLEGLHPPAARRALAAARNIVDGGSLTVIATAARPFGGETTVIALDPGRAAAGGFPALDPMVSGTLRPALLVGKNGAEAIAKARADAAAGSAVGEPAVVAGRWLRRERG